MAVLPTASESPLVYACELWVFAMCPALRGSTVSYAGDAHFPKHSLEYSLNFWSQSKKKGAPSKPSHTCVDHHCHVDKPLLLKIEPRGPYFLFNHNYALTNMYVDKKFDGCVQITFWVKSPPK